MRIRTLLVLLGIALIAAFSALNWPAFTTPAPLNLGLSTVEAPLGLAMLGLVVFITLAFAIYVAVWQASILMETRRHAKELQAQRTLADQAEASRFTELRGVLHAELEQLEQRIAATQAALRSEIRESTNSLAAMLGEMDDRMKPRLPNATL
jgi:uncharacterized protein YlxW (UPF0749 family)